MNIKNKIAKENFPTCCPCCILIIPYFIFWVISCTKFKEFRLQFIPFVEDFFLNFSLISEKKMMNLSDVSEINYENNINFLELCILFGGNAVFDILSVGSRREEDNILIKYFYIYFLCFFMLEFYL